MTCPPTTTLIGLDWGTTALRAYRMAADGRVLDRRSGQLGILNVAQGDFAAAFDQVAGDWHRADPAAPLLASGMIGSRQGWLEVPYCTAPAAAAGLAAGLGRVSLPDGAVLHIVPGLLASDSGMPDVMRGEETQIVGALADVTSDACCILPGTHSKWARIRHGRIAGFATFMTGELFAVLKEHSILGREMTEDPPAPDAFPRGVTAGLSSRSLLHDLFGVRTLGLTGSLPPADRADYLSGLLIGAEIAEARGWTEQSAQAPLLLLGEGPLIQRYAAALRQAGMAAASGPADAAARGLFRLARAAGLIDP